MSQKALNPSQPKDEASTNPVHWLVRPATIRKLWWLFSLILLVSVLAQFAFKVKGYFVVDGWLGFGAVFGFLSCVAMVLFAKLLGYVLKRPEDYYSQQELEGKQHD